MLHSRAELQFFATDLAYFDSKSTQIQVQTFFYTREKHSTHRREIIWLHINRFTSSKFQ